MEKNYFTVIDTGENHIFRFTFYAFIGENIKSRALNLYTPNKYVINHTVLYLFRRNPKNE